MAVSATIFQCRPIRLKAPGNWLAQELALFGCRWPRDYLEQAGWCPGKRAIVSFQVPARTQGFPPQRPDRVVPEEDRKILLRHETDVKSTAIFVASDVFSGNLNFLAPATINRVNSLPGKGAMIWKVSVSWRSASGTASARPAACLICRRGPQEKFFGLRAKTLGKPPRFK
jgi:hypothetical protein